jgi:hypothetical protein
MALAYSLPGSCSKCGAWLDDHVGWVAVIVPVCPRDVKQPVT